VGAAVARSHGLLQLAFCLVDQDRLPALPTLYIGIDRHTCDFDHRHWGERPLR
jgi:hypothetical protein